MMALDLNAVSQISAARILDCLVEGTLIAIVAASLLRLARSASSGMRFAVWFSALVAIASLAFLEFSPGSNGELHPAGAIAPLLVVPASWAPYIFAAWLVIAGIMLARLAAGFVHVARLRRSCVPLDPSSIDSALHQALDGSGTLRKIELCTSAIVGVPTAIGLFRPAVVLPAWLVDELSPEEKRQLVLHEIAHLRRWDDWTNLAQKTIKAVLFFHPAVWWIEKKASLEREMACDDAVVAATANPRAYAECLAHLAEKNVMRRALTLAQAAVGRMRQTSLRVARILHRDRATSTRFNWVAVAAVIAGFAVVGTVAPPLTPRLIGFASPQPEILAAQSSVTLPAGVQEQNSGNSAIHPAAAKPVSPKTRVEPRLAKSKLRKETPQVATQPEPVRAHWDVSSTAPPPAMPAVYIVVESQYLPSGVVVWRSTVWRIVSVPPADPNTRTPRKQI